MHFREADHMRGLARPTRSERTLRVEHGPQRFDDEAMSKATISRRVLDTLIRAKLAKTGGCENVEPLPVAWKDPNANGCNWEIPGWTGDAKNVAACAELL